MVLFVAYFEHFSLRPELTEQIPKELHDAQGRSGDAAALSDRLWEVITGSSLP